MIKIVFIVPESEFVEVVERVYAEHEKLSFRAGGDNLRCSFSVCVAKNQRLIPRHVLEADIIIGRGMIISDLKRVHPHISLVEVPIRSEMVSILARVRKEHPGERVAIFGSSNMLFSASGLDEAMEMDIKTFHQEGNEEYTLKRDMARLLDAGFKVIVCGPATYTFARALDCFPYRLGMFEESIREALIEAKHWAVIRRRQRIKSVQFQAVLNSAHEGIIATDTSGRITVFNGHAADILRIAPAKAIGARVYDILPMSLLTDEFRTRDQIERIVPLHGEYLSINKTPVTLSGELSGHVITLQGSSAIQRIESEFRRKLYAREYSAPHTLADIIGDSPAIRDAVQKTRAFAESNSNVLILGESGTGKGLFAEAIHNAGERRHAPFVAMNCGVKPLELLERKLFGCVEGEDAEAPGAIEAAHAGTLFLDEIDKLPPELQDKLEAVLRERLVARIGSNRPTPVDVRVVAASDRYLDDDVREGRFSHALFYCINVLSLSVPNLEQRGSDLLHLAAFFLDEFCQSYRKKSITLSDDACEMLKTRHWAGNVRELRNVCECLVVLNRNGLVGEEDIERVFEESFAANRAEA